MNNENNINDNSIDNNENSFFNLIEIQNSSFATTINSINTVLCKKISAHSPIIEGVLCLIDSNEKLIIDEYVRVSRVLSEKIKYFESQGILKWVSLQNQLSSIPQMELLSDDKSTNYHIFPTKIGKYLKSFFIFSSNQLKIDEINQQSFAVLLKEATLLYNALLINEDNRKLRLKQKELDKELFRNSVLSSISEIITMISDEIHSSLKVLETNHHLIQSGINNNSQRTDIINKQILQIRKLNKKLNNLMFIDDKDKIKMINLKILLDDVIDFSSLKLKQMNIALSVKYDDIISKPIIKGNYSNLEKSLFNIIMFCSEQIGESGKITVHFFEENDIINLTISDDSKGVEEDKINELFEPISLDTENNRVSLYFSSQVVKNQNGLFSFYSEPNNGNSIKISLPLIKDIEK